MPEAFDPYHQWLGIHKDEQPPHHYRLLGVRIFESNLTVIENAADRIMLHLRSLSLGPHAARAQQLLNEVSAARICLLDSDLKGPYDAQLAAALPRPAPRNPPLHPAFPVPVMSVTAPPVTAPPVSTPAATSAPPAQPRFLQPVAPQPARSRIDRSSRNPASRGFGWIEIAKIVIGGLAGIAIAQVIIFYALDIDLLGVMGPARDRTNASIPPQNPGVASVRKVESHLAPSPPAVVNVPFPSGNALPPAPTRPSVRSPLSSSRPPRRPQSVPPPTATITGEPRPSPPDVTIAPTAPPPVVKVQEPAAPVTEQHKSPVPTKEERAELQKRMRGTFSREFNKPPSRENKKALLELLLESAASSTVNEKDRFILLSEALTCAITLKELAKGAEIVDRVEQLYEVDPLSLRSYYLGKFSDAAGKEDRKPITLCALELADHALALQRWDEAAESTELAQKQLPYLAPQAAKNLKEAVELRSRRLADLREKWDAIVAARKLRETSPGDPSACVAEGRFRCFYEGDWRGGLPLLAKGTDKQLSELAKKDLDAGGPERAALDKGDAWYDAAKSNPEHAAGLARASFYYRIAKANAGGLEQERIRRRLDEIDALRLPRHLVTGEGGPGRLRRMLDVWNSD